MSIPESLRSAESRQTNTASQTAAFPQTGCMEPPRCQACGAPLSRDEIGLTKKLINRGSTSFFCIACLGRHFQVEEAVLREKIREFRDMGCTLFL